MFNWFRNRKKSNSSCFMEWFQGEGVVSETICPNKKGRVYFRGTWWPAKCCDNSTLEPDEIVEVIGNDSESITLLVKSLKVDSRSQSESPYIKSIYLRYRDL